MKKIVVLLAGGEGKRFKASMETDTPKQFYRETPASKNMLEKTLQRMRSLQISQNMEIVVVVKKRHLDFIDQCQGFSGVKVIEEADDCLNTGPAIFNVLSSLLQQYGDSVVGFFPVDHEYSDDALFTDKVARVFRVAQKAPGLFIFGSKIEEFDDQKGYINTKAELSFGDAKSNFQIFRAVDFLEKPSLQEIEEKSLLVENLLVNMGIFIGRTSTFLRSYLGAAIACRGERFAGDSFDKEILSKFQGHLYVSLVADFSWKDLGVIKEKPEITNQSS